ncbi:hypothetical protein SBA1_140050 [Candidatus Sulfotelmatobacter kueseliae]|uniref:Uncharacterized protein n=1 Tax=Candidatus Sulfotelmatobacter kueseliae TaxID=2042962 RepID=A0A2U3K6H8_9BACT|nr:hypothetical protein SBA1_140050 [Candidatus Sulfotelmatobacter kueseliae]
MQPVHPRGELHALSGAGVYGRKHARAFHAGLREVICEDRSSVGEYAGERAQGGEFDPNSVASVPYRNGLSPCLRVLPKSCPGLAPPSIPSGPFC